MKGFSYNCTCTLLSSYFTDAVSLATPQLSVEVAMPPNAVAGQKKSWGIGARHREQLGAQKKEEELPSGEMQFKRWMLFHLVDHWLLPFEFIGQVISQHPLCLQKVCPQVVESRFGQRNKRQVHCRYLLILCNFTMPLIRVTNRVNSLLLSLPLLSLE